MTFGFFNVAPNYLYNAATMNLIQSMKKKEDEDDTTAPSSINQDGEHRPG
jgi:hypothetical protein